MCVCVCVCVCSYRVQVKSASTVAVDPGYLSMPQAIEFPSKDGRTCVAAFVVVGSFDDDNKHSALWRLDSIGAPDVGLACQLTLKMGASGVAQSAHAVLSAKEQRLLRAR